MQNLNKKLKCKLLLLHKYFMHIGKYSGCHQMPERSFFINGMQFPLCARCTGILVGYLVGVLLFVFDLEGSGDDSNDVTISNSVIT